LVLTTFEIPDELLGLLGLSQAVFIAENDSRECAASARHRARGAVITAAATTAGTTPPEQALPGQALPGELPPGGANA
jgi:hypothetical protein